MYTTGTWAAFMLSRYWGYKILAQAAEGVKLKAGHQVARRVNFLNSFYSGLYLRRGVSEVFIYRYRCVIFYFFQVTGGAFKTLNGFQELLGSYTDFFNTSFAALIFWKL